MCVDCLRFWKYDEKYDIVSGFSLKLLSNLSNSFECDIVSYALDKSMYIASVGCLLNLCLCILLVIVCSASVVLESVLCW